MLKRHEKVNMIISRMKNTKYKRPTRTQREKNTNPSRSLENIENQIFQNMNLTESISIRKKITISKLQPSNLQTIRKRNRTDTRTM